VVSGVWYGRDGKGPSSILVLGMRAGIEEEAEDIPVRAIELTSSLYCQLLPNKSENKTRGSERGQSGNHYATTDSTCQRPAPNQQAPLLLTDYSRPARPLPHITSPANSLVIGESHMALTQPNRVLSFTNAIKYLKVFFRDTSLGEVHLDSLDSDIGRSGRDIEFRRDVDGGRERHGG